MRRQNKHRGGYTSIPGMSSEQTGLFGTGPATATPNITLHAIFQMLRGMIGTITGVSGGGSGPYRASYSSYPSLPKHTIYQPDSSTLPPSYTLPIILWGNGGCRGYGGWFSKFLIEIASHGYFVIANGIPQLSGIFSSTKHTDIPDAINWVHKNAGQGEWKHLDKSRLAVAGQSCGGLQAYSASLDERVTLTAIFNSGLIHAENTKYFDRLHAPVGFFCGGVTDIAYGNCERDYQNMPHKIPTVKLNLPVGHMGTYGRANGGLFGKAAVAFFDWHLKADEEMGRWFLQPQDYAELVGDGWDIVSKGYLENMSRN